MGEALKQVQSDWYGLGYTDAILELLRWYGDMVRSGGDVRQVTLLDAVDHLQARRDDNAPERPAKQAAQ